jgi:hypothetical protein
MMMNPVVVEFEIVTCNRWQKDENGLVRICDIRYLSTLDVNFESAANMARFA